MKSFWFMRFSFLFTSLPVRGAWIEIALALVLDYLCRSRSPCGERGLKYKLTDTIKNIDKSLPVRGAWIEIDCLIALADFYGGRSPCGERGLKCGSNRSPVRADAVAPRAGSVD